MTEDIPEDDGLRIVPATEILEKIEKGELVEYKKVLIKGDLDISRLDLPKNMEGRFTITSKISIIDSEFSGHAFISGSQFDDSVDFSGSIFRGATSFDKSHFSKVINFKGSVFNDVTVFNESQFSENTLFSESQFCDLVDFSISQFDEIAAFNESQFSRGAFFNGSKFGKVAFFRGSQFDDSADFSESTFNTGAYFVGSTFSEAADFNRSNFMGPTFFNVSKFDKDVNFIDSMFGGPAYFIESQFNGDAYFIDSKFDGRASFSESKFSRDVFFNISEFSEGIDFIDSKFIGESLTFEGTVFKDLKSQEDACRRAKRVLEESGRVDEADYYYFMEMEAKRLQNSVNFSDILNNYFDYEMLLFGNFPITTMPSLTNYIKFNIFGRIFIKNVFRYGTDPYRVIKSWFMIVFILGFLYLAGQGVEKSGQSISFFEYFYFSIITAATPGYGGYTPKPGIYTIIAGAEAIFGVFMWGAFITTFTRKYMR